MIFMLSGLVWFTLTYYEKLQSENETVRQWGRISDRLHVAIGAGQRMQSILKKMSPSPSVQDEDLLFNYIEQHQIFSDSVNCPECFDKMPKESQKYIEQSVKELMFKEPLEVESASKLLETFLPRLETSYQLIWAKKREAYIKYYENLQITGPILFNVSIAILIMCVTAGLALSFWTITMTRKRLAALSSSANRICQGIV